VGAPLGSLEGGTFTRDFERRTLGVENLSLREFCEGNLVGGLHCWGPWKIRRKDAGEGPPRETGRGLVYRGR
jgi:hypothetical protein